ncbi:MAG TPA: polysaccharide deacetylase family protein [Candidatus Acidoferrales bacterium]|nr:polysaccharide deacetylase family protein [Candidatus Acidoferrales bacterium]
MLVVRAVALFLVCCSLAHADQRDRSDGDCAFRDGVFLHGRRTSHDVALTFDACPTRKTPGFAADIVDYLRREGVPATFFISGGWARKHEPALTQLASVPAFELALHGDKHIHLTGASSAAIEKEIDDGRVTLEKLRGSPQPLFRPPFGETPATLPQATQTAAVTPVLWDVAPGDPDPHETAAMLEQAVLQRTRGGSIIVLHVNGRGVGTAAAIPAIVAGLRARGFNFVTVSSLLHACASTGDSS